VSRSRKRGELTGGEAFSRLLGKRQSLTSTESTYDGADDQRKRETQVNNADDQRLSRSEMEGDAGLRVQIKREPSFEETHTRATFWLPNELLDDLDAFAKRTGLSKSQIVARATRYFIENAEIEE
jgi:hypothetical protein